MTPTKQDKELLKLQELIKSCFGMEPQEDWYDSYRYSDRVRIRDFITADRKRVALEARIDELEQVYPQLQKHHGVSGEGNYYYDDRIAELKAQQEEFGDN